MSIFKNQLQVKREYSCANARKDLKWALDNIYEL